MDDVMLISFERDLFHIIKAGTCLGFAYRLPKEGKRVRLSDNCWRMAKPKDGKEWVAIFDDVVLGIICHWTADEHGNVPEATHRPRLFASAEDAAKTVVLHASIEAEQ